MALIACKDCGGDVSSDAKACPKCGAPIAQPLWTKQATQLVMLFFAIIAFLVMMAALA